MPKNLLIATFSDPDRLIRAVRNIRRKHIRIYDVYTPYPVHDLDEAMGIRRSRLPWVTLMMGVSALVLTLLSEFYTAVFDWPLNVGGKPDNSTLAFIPISFELTVLVGALATVAALFLRAELYPGKRSGGTVKDATNDTFVLIIRRRDASFDASKARLLLEHCGAESIEEKVAEL
ncbi:MAG TPA: DUF3341 domain-containing protein [Bryobacteraceae bacterium]|nr:DUF3341 domain-containing protein [Bryobacteraceae bacterium]